jgi:glycosyltransferase involved in cell wall biosynthesis
VARRKIILVSHFPLSEVTGVTVMITEILRLWPRVAAATDVAHLSYPELPSRTAVETLLTEGNDKTSTVVGINLHIDVEWNRSLELFELCRARGIAAYNYVFDYWPHHRDNVECLTGRYGVRLLALTDFVGDLLRRDGFAVATIPAGVALPDAGGAAGARAGANGSGPVGSAGRLSPRKRFPDIVRGFCAARQGQERLYLRLLPSLVFQTDEDAAQLRLVGEEIRQGNGEGFVDIDRTPVGRHDYSRYSTYVCASTYEGFSMSPIEASYYGCPALMSEIPPHRRIADTLFGGDAGDFLFPVGDTDALARLLRDELATGRRRKLIAERQAQIHSTITTNWSLETTAKALANLAEPPAHA